MEFQQFIALAVFFGVFVLFAARFVHRAIAAVLGTAVLALVQGPVSIVSSVIPEVVLVTAGLMVLSGFMKRSGLAEWLALTTAKAGKGRPVRILILTGLLSFLIGAFLGPVAAVVLVLPVSLVLAVELDVPSLPFVVILSWTSLLGGATTMTAGPGNLWVAAALGIDGATWVYRMIPFTASALVLTLTVGAWVFRRSLRVTNERRARVLEYDPSRSVEDKKLLVKTLTVLLLVALGFILGPWSGITPSVVVIGGVALLWLWDGPKSVERSLTELDGGTLLFYGGLFAVVGSWGASDLANFVAATFPPNPWLALWSTALLGAFVDHGAVTGALVPILKSWDSSQVWPFVVLGSSLGAGATGWGALSSATAIDLAGSKPSEFGLFLRFGLLFLVLNLVLIGGLAVLFPH